MDPLSITASVITVLAATGKVGEGLEKLWALKGAPHELLALINEVSRYLSFDRQYENAGLTQRISVLVNRSEAFTLFIVP